MTFLAVVLSSSTDNSTLSNVEPGLLGFLVVAGIGIALVFLLRSMNKQFRKLGPPPEEAEAGSAEGDADPGAASDADAQADGGRVGGGREARLARGDGAGQQHASGARDLGAWHCAAMG